MYNVIEIFNSIEGEGIRQGYPATFIRLAGCNLRCAWCDTKHAYESPVFTPMTAGEILKQLNPNLKRVTLTGGEPLAHENIFDLVFEICGAGYELNIETNGSVDITKIPRLKGLFFTVDYKLPSSGENAKMLWKNFESLKKEDVIKFVAGDCEDIDSITDMLRKLSTVVPHVYIGAVHGKYDEKKLAEVLLSVPLLKEARLQVQLHKIIGVK